MTYKYKNVYIADTSIVGGKYEKTGPLGDSFDKTYKCCFISISHLKIMLWCFN